MKTYKTIITTLICVIIIIVHACKKENSIQQTANYKADIVSETLARQIAEHLDENFAFISRNKSIKFAQLQQNNFPTPNRQIVGSYVLKDKNNIPALYIYNYANDSGFVVISADMKHEPICAYITKGGFTPKDHVPSMFANWFGKTVENIEILRDGLYDNTNRAKTAWTKIARNIIWPPPGDPEEPPLPSCPDYFYEVGPLLNTTWGQGCTYNELCPSKGCSEPCPYNANSWTGCVATAMAQVIRYWKPANKYGYNYATMPDDRGNIEIQKLMRDCGLRENVNTDYGCSKSSASSGEIPGALKRNFGFTSAATLRSYNPGDMSIIADNLFKGMPVLLDGCAARSGLFGWSYDKCHEWVCDGYREYASGSGPDDCFGYRYIHMNWGWHEAGTFTDYNGWFNWNDWNVPGVSNFQYARGFIYNIHP